MTQFIFVTGTSTDIGKTYVASAAAIAYAASARVAYWKPVQTGKVLDADTVRERAGPALDIIPSLAIYPDASSPDQAAAKAGMSEISVSAIVAAWHAIVDYDLVIVEGAGGLLVPLNAAAETWADLLTRVSCHVWVVAASGLGTLNHTALTLEALRARRIPVAAVILNGPLHADNQASLRRMFPDIRYVTTAEELERPEVKTAAPSREWEEWDRAHVWHPYTQHQTALEPIAIQRASGAMLETVQGQQLIDGIGSWWVNTIGHGRPEIGRALARQQAKLDHCLFAGARHEPAARLAARVITAAGQDFTRVFFSDNGSSAVEIAFKMLMQSAAQRGDHGRRLIVCLDGAYHGDTFGAMAAGRGSGFFDPFQPYLFETIRIKAVTHHASRVCPEGSGGRTAALKAWRELLQQRHTEILGLIIEPLLQGAGGMLMHDQEWLQGLGAAAKEFGVPLIADEVFTGMGRLGSWFGFQRAGIKPDIVCLAKGLTGGSVPLALTLTREALFSEFLAPNKDRAFLHGHSFTANPIACAAALATFDIYDHENLVGAARGLESTAQQWFQSEVTRFGLVAPRSIGGVMAFELEGSGLSNYFHTASRDIVTRAQAHGLFIRPLGNTIYLAPPLAIDPAVYERALACLSAALEDLSLGA